jgi:hypothetical protein
LTEAPSNETTLFRSARGERDDGGDALSLHWWEAHPWPWRVGLNALIWNLLTFGVALLVIAGKLPSLHPAPLAGRTDLLIFPAIGFYPIYGFLALVLNRTTYAFGPAELRVASGPLPWWPFRQCFPYAEIAEARAERTQLGRRGGYAVVYRVVLQLRGGPQVSIRPVFARAADAAALAAAIRRRLLPS